MNPVNESVIESYEGYRSVDLESRAASASPYELVLVLFDGLLDELAQKTDQPFREAKAAMDALSEEFAPRQRTILAKQQELEELSEKANRDAAVMGETERRNMEKDLRDLQREVARMQTEFREDLNLRRNEELGNLQRSLLKEVQDYAETSGFDLVVGDGVLYASSAVNITEVVLRAMEENFQAAGN